MINRLKQKGRAIIEKLKSMLELMFGNPLLTVGIYLLVVGAFLVPSLFAFGSLIVWVGVLLSAWWFFDFNPDWIDGALLIEIESGFLIAGLGIVCFLFGAKTVGFILVFLGGLPILYAASDYEKIKGDQIALKLGGESLQGKGEAGYRVCFHPWGRFVKYSTRLQEFDYQEVELLTTGREEKNQNDDRQDIMITCDLAVYFLYPNEAKNLWAYYKEFGGPEDREKVKGRIRQEIITLVRGAAGQISWLGIYRDQDQLETKINENVGASEEDESNKRKSSNQQPLFSGMGKKDEEEEKKDGEEEKSPLDRLSEVLREIQIRLTKIDIPEELENALPKKEIASLEKLAQIVEAEAAAEEDAIKLRKLTPFKYGLKYLILDALTEVGQGEGNTTVLGANSLAEAISGFSLPEEEKNQLSAFRDLLDKHPKLAQELNMGGE